MRKYLIGFICGLMVITLIPAYALVEQYILTKATYKVVVNNVEYIDNESPILNYNGTTYVPLKKVADLLGVDMKWNGVAKQAEITKDSVSNPEPSASPVVEEPTENPKWFDMQYDGQTFYDCCIYNGVTYIGPRHISDYLNFKIFNKMDGFTDDEFSYIVYSRRENREIIDLLIYKHDSSDIYDGEKVLVNIPYIKLESRICIEYDYFINTILPSVNIKSGN